jgi:membrane protein required for colicin V production
MPSYLDLGLIAVVLISALLSMLRGLTREVLAIASWGAAAAAAYYLYPLVLPYVHPYLQKDALAMGVSAGLVFFVTLIVVSLLTIKISDAILDSKVGALDRSLGFLFGAGRGYLLCTIAFVFFTWLVPDKSYPQWVENSKTRAWLQQTGEGLQAMLPQDLDASIGNWLSKRKLSGGTPGTPDDSDPGQTQSPVQQPRPNGQAT